MLGPFYSPLAKHPCPSVQIRKLKGIPSKQQLIVDSVQVCDVALDPRKGGQDAVWTYRTTPGLGVGDAVTVPLGTRTELGFVIKLYEATEEDLAFPLKSLRGVSSRVEGLSLPSKLIHTILHVSNQYLCTPAAAIAPALPPGVRDRLQTSWKICGAPSGSAAVSAVQQEVLRVMEENGGILAQQKGKPLAPGILRALKALTASGLVERTLKVVPPEERKKSDPLLRLSADSGRVETFLEKEAKRKPAQALTVMSLQSAERGMLTGPEIKALASVTDATVKALLQAGILEEVGEEEGTKSTPPTPGVAQRIAIEAIVHAVQEKEPQGFLLFGVTGSGKTEVYLRAAAEALRGGRKVLYLVPEIALATQAIGLLRQRFGKSVTILHSSLSESDRLKNWLSVRDGHAPVVLGARSALFAPLENIGLIILDEEHEQAYKQESAPRYHAKQVALKLGELHRCPVVLGSATPSVESFFEAEQRERSGSHGLTLLTLPERAASSRLPTVTIQDLSLGYRRHNPSILSEELRTRIHEALARKEQVILFLNRRAYAPFLICRDCGHTLECPNCSVSLSFHRRENRMRCHHCGWQAFPPELCPSCQGKRMAPFGAGTEKVEEAVAAEFPDVKVGRLDRDIARRKGALEEIFAAFRTGEISILVGTQIVAKGLDFPNVTLVGVIAADVSLNLPDFRASERTFQLLSQVAGRAGRGTAKGHVVIQTFNPEHPAVLAAQKHDYLEFYEKLIKERKEANYPPFKRLVNILLSGEEHKQVLVATEKVAQLVSRHCPDFRVLGPVDCAVERAFGKWRRHVLVKLPPLSSASPIANAIENYDPEGVQILLDVDPYSMM